MACKVSGVRIICLPLLNSPLDCVRRPTEENPHAPTPSLIANVFKIESGRPNNERRALRAIKSNRE